MVMNISREGKEFASLSGRVCTKYIDAWCGGLKARLIDPSITLTPNMRMSGFGHKVRLTNIATPKKIVYVCMDK